MRPPPLAGSDRRCHLRTVSEAAIKAVLGPTNTGKTHLAIERMCGHSSGAIGFPLRLLAREVYDRVRAIKGEASVALITGEERIEPPAARYFLCTMEAMGDGVIGRGRDVAFVGVDEAQLGADRERGHVFTDRLLNARGREETMILGAATLEPLVRALVPAAEIVTRPRFSSLTHAGGTKLSRLPPRSAVIGFSAEQVYALAEALRRFRGGAAVVMGALSPETRNRQVELYQSGEVDYIVATDAIGMGLNLDVHHVAFASLTKFDGVRQRRLVPAEMAQIAGRAGRHQRDGSFGTLTGQRGGGSPELTDEEVYAIEEHRFKPLTRLFWREPEPRFDDLATLIADLEAPPQVEGLSPAPEAIDLALLKRLADEAPASDVTTPGRVRRFWEACSLPDFRGAGVDMHARFVARLWSELKDGYLGADYAAARIAELDVVSGDIDTLQGRIAAIRSWAYICQRPDWVLARDEMAARARAVEARLSDALHARLTERFVNRRTTALLRSLGKDAALLPVAIGENDTVTVEGAPFGRLRGFAFDVDPDAPSADRKMMLAAAEKALPRLLADRAERWIDEGLDGIALVPGRIEWRGVAIAHIELASGRFSPAVRPARNLALLPEVVRAKLMRALEDRLDELLRPLEPLAALHDATRDPSLGADARAIVHALIEGHGVAPRAATGLAALPRELRPLLRRLGIVFGSLDLFVPALLKPGARRIVRTLGIDPRPMCDAMTPVVALNGDASVPGGYRRAGGHAIRVDIAEKLLRSAHDRRRKQGHRFVVDRALAVSTGLTVQSFDRLLSAGGFRRHHTRALRDGEAGPPAPDLFSWRGLRNASAGKRRVCGGASERVKIDPDSPFAALASLVE